MGGVLLFDIESTNLHADFGYVLCVGYKWLGQKTTHILSLRDFPHKSISEPDSALVDAARKKLSEADTWVTWYGKRFDVPFLNSRLLLRGKSSLPPVPHVDGWEVARKHLRLHSNRLASVSSFLGLEEKTPLSGTMWIAARAGEERSLKYVEKHCAQDVNVLEQAYLKLRPLMTQHPNVWLGEGAVNSCRTCGKKSLQPRGWRYSAVGRARSYVCGSCGAWSRGKYGKLSKQQEIQ